MAGLLDAIAGSNDPSTADPNTGLVDAQRRQLLFNTLGQTGALLLAAGEPQSGAQRSQMLAQLGNVPGNTQAAAAQMQSQNFNAQRTQALARQNQQQTQLAQYMQTPEFQKLFETLPPAQKAVVAASAKSGDINATLKALQEGIQMSQWKPAPDGSYYNAGTGMVLDPTRGTMYNVGQMAQQASGGGAPSGLSGIGAGTGVGVGPTGEDYLKTLPEGYANTLRAYQDGRMQISPMMARTPGGRKIIEDLNRVEPGFDQTDYGARFATAKAFSSGKEAQSVRALNQVTQHMQTLHDKMATLNNFSSPLLNYGVNQFQQKLLGSRAQTDVLAAAHPVAEELSKAFKGANLSDSEVRQWEQSLGRDMSPEQQQGSLETLQHLLGGAQDALSNQYSKVMKKDLNPLTAKAQASIDYIKTHPLDHRDLWPENQQRVPASGGPAQQGATPNIDPRLLEEARRRGLIR